MAIVTVDAEQTDLSRLLEQAAAGEEIVIVKSGTRMAKLVPIAPKPRGMRPMGLLSGMGTVPDDFNNPLPDELVAAFEGR